ncbi:MAG: ATP-binding protein [Thermoguttaceae bacterium]
MSHRLTLRMAAPSIVISLLLFASGTLGAWYVQNLQKSTAATLKLDMATIHAAEQLVLSVTEVRSELSDFLVTGSRAHLEAIPAKCAEMDRCLRETEELVDDEDEKALAGRIRDGYERFVEAFQQVPGTASDARTRQAVERLNDELALPGVLAPAKDLLALEEKLNRQSGDKNQRMAAGMATVLWLFGIFGAVAGVVAGFGIARGVTRSIVELYVPVRAASGKLEEVVGPVDLIPSAGIESLDVILHKMTDQIGTVVDRLQQSQVEVLRAEQMAALGQLAAGMAHELRNPLTAMKMLIQNAVKARPANGLTDRDLGVLEAETTRLERSLQTFLDFARPPALQKRPGDVCRAIGQTLELIRARADRQGVRIRCELPDRPLVIDADHEQLRQLFLNLLLNALDALPQGGGIRIAAARSGPLAARNGGPSAPECVEDSTSWTTVTVADNGPGIPRDLGDQVFAPYVSTKDTGLGLGLAICRQIVQLHGGQITASNAPEGGAVFTVRLPTSALFDQHRAEVPD